MVCLVFFFRSYLISPSSFIHRTHSQRPSILSIPFASGCCDKACPRPSINPVKLKVCVAHTLNRCCSLIFGRTFAIVHDSLVQSIFPFDNLRIVFKPLSERILVLSFFQSFISHRSTITLQTSTSVLLPSFPIVSLFWITSL